MIYTVRDLRGKRDSPDSDEESDDDLEEQEESHFLGFLSTFKFGTSLAMITWSLR